MEKSDFFVSRDVVFCETEFPYHDINKSEIDEEKNLWIPLLLNEEETKKVGRQIINSPNREIGLANTSNIGPNLIGERVLEGPTT